MTLKVIGAGLGRTGTLSLKGALETLLGGTAYHMAEVFYHPAHVPIWSAAAAGEAVDWKKFFEPYVATTDFPACLFWRELSNIYPDAVVLLSTRSDVDTWWASAHETIFSITAEGVGPERADWWTMWQALKAARASPRTCMTRPPSAMRTSATMLQYGAQWRRAASSTGGPVTGGIRYVRRWACLFLWCPSRT